MESPEVQSSQQSKPEAPDSSVVMSQASQPAPPDPTVVVSQPSVGGVIGKRSVHTGRTVGPFEVQTLIAAGAFAEVYEARSANVGAAAVKIGPLLEPRRFERELSALKGVTHPNLIKFYEGGTFSQDGKEFFWLAMEYPGPTTLASLIERKELDSAGAMELFGQLLDALVALHGAGFAHRDLKPRNILVNGGKLKLIDFGLTKTARSGDDSLTITGQLVGTPRYMSPEQVRGVTEVGQAADLWAAGVILFEMLTFVPLFDGLNQMQLGAQILTQNIPSRLTHDRVPGTLRKWLIDLLNRDDPRARGNVKEARAIFGTLTSPLIARLKDVKRRSNWRRIDETRLLEAFLAGEAPGASPIDVARRFVLFAEKHGITGLRVEDVVQVIASPDGAIEVLPELKPELRPEFSIQLDASPQLLKQLEQLRVRAQVLWIGCALSAVAAAASIAYLGSVSKKAGSVTYFGELALFVVL
ncbi:partial Serine/threonine-protein kinase StkP, partial [Planctomycetaceae bacterium]